MLTCAPALEHRQYRGTSLKLTLVRTVCLILTMVWTDFFKLDGDSVMAVVFPFEDALR